MREKDRKDKIRLRVTPHEADLCRRVLRGEITVADAINGDKVSRRKQKEILSLRNKYRKLLDSYDELENKLSFYKSVESVKINKRSLSPKNTAKSKSNSVAVFILSDWHVEETVNADKINGINEYNPKVAEERVKVLFKNFITSINIQRHGTKIDTLILGLLGDFISGYIHPELVENNAMSPIKAILFCQELLIWGIEYLLKNGKFKNIIVPCCYGNHSRTTPKTQVGTASDNSFEYLMYCNLARHFSNNNKVKFQVSEGYHTYVKIFDKYNLRFHHGDSIKGGTGALGLYGSATRLILKWNDNESAYMDFFGHFHRFECNDRYMCNNSLIGHNAYGNQFGFRVLKSSQGFCLIEENYGLTINHQIFAE